MYTLTIEAPNQTTTRTYATAVKAKRGFYSSTYNNPTARVTLTDPAGRVIRIGLQKRTIQSQDEET